LYVTLICDSPNLEGESEERERERWAVVRDTTMSGGKNLSPVLKVHRQCPFALPVGVKQLTGIIEV
jgi:hypothetical protein